MKHLQTYNESIKNYLKPKSDDKIIEDLSKMSSNKILVTSIEHNYIIGFKYLIDNNLVDETTKYLIEKYIFNLHEKESKDYELCLKYILNRLINKTSYNNTILFKNKDNDDLIFKYYNDTKIFQYDNMIYYSILQKKFNLNRNQSNILIKGIAEKFLRLNVSHLNWL